MPELPEVEQIRRTLEPVLIGATITAARLNRRDVFQRQGYARGKVQDHELLAGSTITQLLRHGKNLAVVADTGRVLCIHLGMSGQLRFIPDGQQLEDRDHIHAVWEVHRRGAEVAERSVGLSQRSTGHGIPQTKSHLRALCASVVNSLSQGTLIFRDPRRFGGIWAYESIESLREHRWNALGPDALTITGELLHAQLHGSKRPIKSALLDQAVLAGVGNIYADEALFAARIHPAMKAHRLDEVRAAKLAASIVEILSRAIVSGGSTIRSYVDSTGQGGGFAQFHQVYGRGGQHCPRCGRILSEVTLAQRTTVFCPTCQPIRTPSGRPRHHLSTMTPQAVRTPAREPKQQRPRSNQPAACPA